MPDPNDVIDVEQLSRGTQQQLCLAIRLGLARTLGQRTARLPLMMDAVLVNADRGRARAVALTQVARDHQILHLTCHPANAQLLQEAQGGTRVTELPRLGSHVAPLSSAGEQGAVGAGGSEQDVREAPAAWAEPVLLADLRSALPYRSDEKVRCQLTRLERRQPLVKTGQKKGAHSALA